MLRAPGRMRAFISSEPCRSIIAATMLWIDRNAATEAQDIDSASNTRVALRRVRPVPPDSSET